jgi:hypothetical protein
MTDPPSLTRGRPPRGQRQRLYEKQIWSWVPEGAQHQDWPSAVTWLWLWPKTSIAGQPLGWPHKSKIGHCSDSSPEKPRNHLPRLFTREANHRSLARHTPPARLPTATPALHRRKKFSSPLLLLATHRNKFFRHLFSCSPTQKALSRIPLPFSQQALIRAPQSLSGAHDSLWIHIPTHLLCLISLTCSLNLTLKLLPVWPM